MTLKTKWDSNHFKPKKLYVWIFTNSATCALNDDSYSKTIRKNYLNKNTYYSGTKIRNGKGPKNESK